MSLNPNTQTTAQTSAVSTNVTYTKSYMDNLLATNQRQSQSRLRHMFPGLMERLSPSVDQEIDTLTFHGTQIDDTQAK